MTLTRLRWPLVVSLALCVAGCDSGQPAPPVATPQGISEEEFDAAESLLQQVVAVAASPAQPSKQVGTVEPLPVFPNGVRQWKGVNAVVLQPEDGNRLGCELVPTRVKRHLVPPVDADCLGWRKGGGVRPLLHLAEIVGAGDHANAKASYYRGMVKDLEYVLVLRVESVEEITVTGPDAQKSFQGGDATGRAELYRLPDTYLGSFGFKTSLRYTVNERGAGLAAGSDKVSLKLHPGQRPKEFLASLLDISIRRGVDRSYPQALANQGEGPFGSQVGE